VAPGAHARGQAEEENKKKEDLSGEQKTDRYSRQTPPFFFALSVLLFWFGLTYDLALGFFLVLLL
jgi:hypothetical protein